MIYSPDEEKVANYETCMVNGELVEKVCRTGSQRERVFAAVSQQLRALLSIFLLVRNVPPFVLSIIAGLHAWTERGVRTMVEGMVRTQFPKLGMDIFRPRPFLTLHGRSRKHSHMSLSIYLPLHDDPHRLKNL